MKKGQTIFIIIVVAVLAVVGYFYYSLDNLQASPGIGGSKILFPERFTREVTPTPTLRECIDSDGGDVYTKGNVRVYISSDPGYITYWDECVSTEEVKEWTCEDGQAVALSFDCDFGCGDGACQSVILKKKSQFPFILPQKSGFDNIPYTVVAVNQELFATRMDGYLYGFNYLGHGLPGFPVKLASGTNGRGISSIISVSDLNDDGLEDFVVMAKQNDGPEGTWVFVFVRSDESYSQVDSWFIEGEGSNSPRTHPTIADINNDGIPEIIAFVARTLYAWTPNGTLVSGFPFVYESGTWAGTSVAVADFDGDGFLEIAAQGGDSHLYLLDYEGNEIWHRDVRTFSNSPVIGDVDQDGRLEIVCMESYYGIPNVGIIIFDEFGNEEGRIPIDNSAEGEAPALSDLDGDGDLEIISSHFMGLEQFLGDEQFHEIKFVLSAYHHTGEMLEGWPFTMANRISSSPAIVKMNEDGSKRVFALVNEPDDSRPRLIVLSGDGRLLQQVDLELKIEGEIIEANNLDSVPVITDIDSDGVNEVLFTWAHNACIYCPPEEFYAVVDAYEIMQPSAPEWPQFQGDFALTGKVSSD